MENVLITISDNICNIKNCIMVIQEPRSNTIIIEGVWTTSTDIIERAITGLISHETIELALIELDLDDNLHELIGRRQTIKDYTDNLDGIVYKGKKVHG